MKIDLIMNLYYEPVEMLQNYLKHNTHLYIPINCGNLSVPVKSEFAKKHIKFEDEMQFNIAPMNPRLNECTAIYAYWKNIMKNPDYVGFQHYRRFFNQADFLDIDKYDIIDTTPIKMLFNMSFFTGDDKPNIVKTTIEKGFYICHKVEAWHMMEDELKKTPFYPFFEDWKNQDALTSPCNLFIIKKKMFEEYCDFIFPILFSIDKKLDISTYDNYQKRQVAFISERLTSLFLYAKKQQGYKSKTIGTMYFSDWKPSTATDKRGQH